MNSYLQAMLRKTNINRASLRRNTDSISETAANQTLDQKHNKNYSVNKEYRYGSEQQNTYSPIKSWNHVENSSDSTKIVSVNSFNRNEDHMTASYQKPWDENQLGQFESTKSRSIYEKHGRLDSNRPSINNEQHSSKNGPNFRNSLSKYNSYKESRSQLGEKTRKTTTIELVPGLIIRGKVTEL